MYSCPSLFMGKKLSVQHNAQRFPSIFWFIVLEIYFSQFLFYKGCTKFKKHNYIGAGFPKDGYSQQDIQAGVKGATCSLTNSNQFIGCRRHGLQASLKLLFREGSYFVDNVLDPWDKIRMGGGYEVYCFYNFLLTWINKSLCKCKQLVILKLNQFCIYYFY